MLKKYWKLFGFAVGLVGGVASLFVSDNINLQWIGWGCIALALILLSLQLAGFLWRMLSILSTWWGCLILKVLPVSNVRKIHAQHLLKSMNEKAVKNG